MPELHSSSGGLYSCSGPARDLLNFAANIVAPTRFISTPGDWSATFKKPLHDHFLIMLGILFIHVSVLPGSASVFPLRQIFEHSTDVSLKVTYCR